MGEDTVSERHVAAVDVLQPDRPVPLEDHFEDDMLWYSFWDDVNGGWLKTDKVDEGSKVGLE